MTTRPRITVHRTRGGDFVATFTAHGRGYRMTRRSRAALDAALDELRPLLAAIRRAEAAAPSWWLEGRQPDDDDLESRRAALVAQHRRLRSLSP